MPKEEPAGKDLKRRNPLALRLVLWVNILIALLTALSLLAPHYSPADFYPLAFLGLSWYYLLWVNVLFIVFWIIFRKRLTIVSLIPLLLSWSNFGHLLQWNSPSEEHPSHPVKILSYNVRLFDLYNWTSNKNTRDRIMLFLKKENADILCLQEFYDNDSHFKILDTFLLILRRPFYHVEYTLKIKDQRFGIATFSKYPIVNRGFIDFNEQTNNACIYTDILKDGDTLRVYNVHLQSNRLNTDDLKFLESLGSGKEVDEIKSSERIFSKLKKGFIRRAAQAEIISEHMFKCPYPKIVCGDFNDSPYSYTYHTMARGMKDAFEERGSGLGKTYNGKFPSFRIDYILYGREWNATLFETLPESFSDHFPIYAVLEPAL
ncbi:MAG: endonuclease/exonuclease/phosphatase family protein [Bacteroidia bacterium]|nr:endonuclease/exonuclease/phosphatase family protein [Bacteroidia bacterium]